MATAKSAKYPHRWPDGTYHSVTWAAHRQNVKDNAPLRPPGEGAIESTPPAGPLPAPTPAPAKPAPVVAAPAEPEGSMGPLPLPVDAAFDDEMAGLLKGRTDDEAAITQGRTRGLLDYGFNEDPTTKALSFDPNNPFSRAALLKKNYDRSRASTGLNMGSRGQLYAGAYQTAQDNVNQGQLGAEDTLQKSLIGFLANNSNSFRQAGTNYELGAARAEGARTGRANTNPLYQPTAAKPAPGSGPGGAAIGATAGGTSTGKPLTPRTLAPVSLSVTAGPGIKGTKTKRKGKTVTYSNTLKGP